MSRRETVATAVVTLRLTPDEAAALASRVDAARAALPDGAAITQSAYLRALIRSALGLARVGEGVRTPPPRLSETMRELIAAPAPPAPAPPPPRAPRRAPGGRS